MAVGAILIFLIIIGAVASLFVVLGRGSKSEPKRVSGRRPPMRRVTDVRAPIGGTFSGDLHNPTPPVPVPPPPPPSRSAPSIFAFKTAAPFWVCPNCECENTLDQTHCRVCFWDRSVEVR